MNLIQKIYKQKIENYLKDIIKTYVDEKNIAVISQFKQELQNPIAENILKYYYFYQYYITDQNESNECLESIDDLLINKCILNKEIQYFFYDYGTIRPTLLKTLYERYMNDELLERNAFVAITKILMYNQVKDWELKCLDKFQFFKSDPFEHRLSRLINKKLGHDALKIQVKYNNNPDLIESYTSNSQYKLIIDKFGLNCEKEKIFDEYSVDIFISSINTIMETDGPDHFYPLQSQLKNRSKFRYHYLNSFFKMKLVSIPYFEWGRQDNDFLASQFLYKLIYSDYSIFDSELFSCNFDLLKPIWKFSKIRVNSGSNFNNNI